MQVQSIKTEHDAEYYNQRLQSLTKDFKDSLHNFHVKKSQIIKDLKDTYLNMIADGFYDRPKYTICASICALLRDPETGENSDSWVRENLDIEYKDVTKTTTATLIRRTVSVKSNNVIYDSEGELLNPFEEFKTQDFDQLSSEEKRIFKREFDDLVKESKRRIRHNRETLNEIIQASDVDTDKEEEQDEELEEHNEKPIPAKDNRFSEILITLKAIVKGFKKLDIGAYFTELDLESLQYHSDSMNEIIQARIKKNS